MAITKPYTFCITVNTPFSKRCKEYMPEEADNGSGNKPVPFISSSYDGSFSDVFYVCALQSYVFSFSYHKA